MTIPAQVDIERRLVDACNALDDAVVEYADVCSRAATAEADYKLDRARFLLALSQQETRRTVAEKDAMVDVGTEDARRAWGAVEAERDVLREAMRSHRTRIDALRTLAANQRAALHP